jgi:parvulin-like peptidyl-prolyl isomerase
LSVTPPLSSRPRARHRALLAALFASALAVVATGCGGGGSSAELAPNDVATVGEIHIAKQRFEDVLGVARASYKAQKRPFPNAGTAEFEAIKAQAMALLVQSAARELGARELGITVTDGQVAKRLAELKQESFKGDDKQYRAQLAKQGLTDAEVRAQIRIALISERVAEQLKAQTQVTDEQVAAYYADNIDDYSHTERDVLHILVGKDEKLAREIHGKLADGAAFGPLAKQYSQDPSSKDKGGQFKAVKGQDVPKFDEVAFSLKPGELSEPFETPEYGWFIIKAVSPVRNVKTSLKDATAGIRQQLLTTAQDEALAEWVTDAADSVCSGGRISYQVGYQPNPDPCQQFTATTTTEAAS